MPGVSHIALDAAFAALKRVAEKTELPLDKSMENYQAWREEMAMERSDDDTRDEAKPKIVEFYEMHPDGDYAMKDVTRHVGLKPESRSDQHFAGKVIKQLRHSKQAAE